MSGRVAAWLAGSLWTLAVALVALGLGLMARNRAGLEFAGQATTTLLFPAVGAVVAARRPRHPIGWLLLAQGLIFAAVFAQLQYTQYTLVTAPGALPGGRWAVWLGTWTWVPMLGLLCLLLLHFPDGRPPSPRWRAVRWLTTGWMASAVVAFALAPGPVNLVSLPGLRVDNPAGLAAASILGPVKAVAGVFTVVPLLAALASLVARFRRARGQERQQLKWLTYAAALAIAAYLTSILVAALVPGELGGLLRALQAFAFALLPIAIGVAVLRHRLYDIDLLINRTLVYGALTATLALVYIGGVVLLQRAAGWLTGQEGSPLAIVASTLAIAALFQPLRRRIQAIIDRRFYRRKYDAQQTLAAFAATLRDETDLERITANLLAVVQETMQPAHVSLWLRPPEGRAGESERTT